MIHFTYKKEVPAFAIDRWKIVNPSYQTSFSLDEDCILFLNEHFPPVFSELFQSIDRGMYKADLWRLCKLYIEGGIYADIDLVPHSSIENLDHDTFYTSLAINQTSLFQAFIKIQPKSPLMLHFLYSLVENKPFFSENGPCFDMYNCLRHYDSTEAETDYTIHEIRIPVKIGESDTSCKLVPLYYFPVVCTFELSPHFYSDTFDFSIENHMLIVTRTDQESGWAYPHTVELVIPFKQKLYLFKEVCMGNWEQSFVTFKGKKLFDSHEPTYKRDVGFI